MCCICRNFRIHILNESNLHNSHPQELFAEDLLNEGYLPLLELATKYGYAKDHLGRLARLDKVKAARCGTQGEWHINEESLKEYRRGLIEKRAARPQAQTATFQGQTPDVGDVELQILDPRQQGQETAPRRDVQSPSRGLHALSTLLLVMGGILCFQLVDVPHAATQTWKRAEHSLPGFTKSVSYIFQPNLARHAASISLQTARLAVALDDTTASLWSDFSDLLDWLFPSEASPTRITIEEYEELESRIKYSESGNQADLSDHHPADHEPRQNRRGHSRLRLLIDPRHRSHRHGCS